MCNACGFQCCGNDFFDECGCDDCHNPECWSKCQDCRKPAAYCDCDLDDDYYPGPAPGSFEQSVQGMEERLLNERARAFVDSVEMAAINPGALQVAETWGYGATHGFVIYHLLCSRTLLDTRQEHLKQARRYLDRLIEEEPYNGD